jgi:hypothetical protein
LYPNKQKYKNKKNTLFLLYKITIKIKNTLKKFLKKLKHEPSLKKPRDFTMPKGCGYPLIMI